MTAKDPSPGGLGGDLAAHLTRFGAPGPVPRKPVLRIRDGVLVTVPVPAERGAGYEYGGAFISPTGAEYVGRPAPAHGLSTLHQLSGVDAQLADLFVEATDRYLDRAEELDGELAALGTQGPKVPLGEVWKLERRAAALREAEGRTLVAIHEMDRLPAGAPVHLSALVPLFESELERVAERTRSVQQGLIDLILLWNTEHSNELAGTANELGRLSNRIAELQNISNLRMLGITYVVLLLALVAAVITIPNTGATILGMPSAAWVPGTWVDIILVLLAVIPLAVVFSRGWILRFLREFGRYEARAAEGIEDIPEHIAGVEAPGRKRGPR